MKLHGFADRRWRCKSEMVELTRLRRLTDPVCRELQEGRGMDCTRVRGRELIYTRLLIAERKTDA